MSKIFKISGNFMLRGKGSEPDPGFVGKIVVDDEDNFYGVCEELYDGPVTVNYKERFLAGSIAPNGQMAIAAALSAIFSW